VVNDPRDALGHEQDDPVPTVSPGPWRVDHSGDLLDRNGRLIGAMLPECRPDDERLVAAAPDLRDQLARMIVGCPVCSGALRFVEGATSDGLYCGHCYPARAVLDRATGGRV
jgi:hypothetical protein